MQKALICDELGQLAIRSGIGHGYPLMRSCATVQTTYTHPLIYTGNCIQSYTYINQTILVNAALSCRGITWKSATVEV